ncbi:hypothetical protein pmac_cds_343 [Pandoravirus macleodensis]|uniref:Uncharacterized protein n=1 Tax=Pandoravirus macleodensis TaxID=2107707 RepID=A0A2U7UF16_9VIRU|nr:hypothetical protein pmac_cds_343 [Pandoravirus macleodensis]AVK77031.1 hypothetical protein pmac_cds_343 [Pandoravirus macleodensis]
MDRTQSPPAYADAGNTDAVKNVREPQSSGVYADDDRATLVQPTKAAPKHKKLTYQEMVDTKREHVARAARFYLQCATEARQRQSQDEARGAFTLGGAWHRLTGIESPEIAAYRLRAETEEAACYRKAASVRNSPWWIESDDDNGADVVVVDGPAPDTTAKNAHRAGRYERLASYLTTQRITESEIEKYPWCIDRHLNREEEQLFQSRSKLGRLQRIFASDDSIPGADTTRRWTNFDIYVCIDNHRYADRMARM